jgi:hypothetical protein
MQSQETRTMHRVASAHTLNQRCAATIMQTMRRMELRGTEGVLKGTEGVLGCWMECVRAHGTDIHAPCDMRQTRPTSDAQRY